MFRVFFTRHHSPGQGEHGGGQPADSPPLQTSGSEPCMYCTSAASFHVGESGQGVNGGKGGERGESLRRSISQQTEWTHLGIGEAMQLVGLQHKALLPLRKRLSNLVGPLCNGATTAGEAHLIASASAVKAAALHFRKALPAPHARGSGWENNR
jgi:hypothetical protein